MKQLILLLLFAASFPAYSNDEELPPVNIDKDSVAIEKKTDDKSWYRNSGEWVASRTVRVGIPTEPASKIVTDGKRYDITVGKRFPFFHVARKKHERKLERWN